MSEPSARIIACPECGKAVKWSTGNPSRPFCSERCKMMDFGSWANEQHRLPVDPDAGEQFSEEDEPSD
ncbi:MAG: DNA gyrase inhibitor YacG [Proteobacteria bacterium]|nr:DNA gyrase inhibitor YacG [Pseudomonadota bacterium]